MEHPQHLTIEGAYSTQLIITNDSGIKLEIDNLLSFFTEVQAYLNSTEGMQVIVKSINKSTDKTVFTIITYRQYLYIKDLLISKYSELTTNIEGIHSPMRDVCILE